MSLGYMHRRRMENGEHHLQGAVHDDAVSGQHGIGSNDFRLHQAPHLSVDVFFSPTHTPSYLINVAVSGVEMQGGNEHLAVRSPSRQQQ
jgi:hypothetical protein